MEMKPFQYGEFSAVIDFTDFRRQEKYEADYEVYKQRIAAVDLKSSSYATQLRALFDAAAFILEETLGEGACNKLLGDSSSVNEAMDAFQALVDYRKSQDDATAASWTEIAEKYSPKNRKQRRAEK